MVRAFKLIVFLLVTAIMIPLAFVQRWARAPLEGKLMEDRLLRSGADPELARRLAEHALR